ncbi:MazG family protein [Streptomyces sp. 71268]|uniref:MazG family protein n=1 Tax=Streptomyces sp. 71268 TaxID=3002640 RepID=UPI0023F75697|nr:MazG family protein [Streptomyces sp. 71268]WEV27395.1 MazG family protein [Streptomyces sp. 71268]
MNAPRTSAPQAAPGTGRLVLLTTTHRVAPGLLSWPAWQTLRAADRVLCADADHPQLPYLRDAGIAVEIAEADARTLVAYCVADAPAAADGGAHADDRAHGDDEAEATAGGHTVVVVTSAAGESALTNELAALAGSGRAAVPDLELLPGSYDLPGARLLDLVQIMDQIRLACPWSSQRTHQDLAKYGIEEAYELVEAIEAGDRDELREELGDVLLQVVFHARVAQDDPAEPFGIDDVAATIVDKLVRRHPHIFGDATARTPEEVKELWLRTKAVEKQRGSVTEGVPLGQPALALAAKLALRARKAGISALPEGPGVGYELLALAARAEAAGIDPETALRAAARTYRDAIRAAEESDGRASGATGAGESAE